MQVPEFPPEHMARAAHIFKALGSWELYIVTPGMQRCVLMDTFPRVIDCTLVISLSTALNTSFLCHPGCCSSIIVIL